jgi:hypothetical protein
MCGLLGVPRSSFYAWRHRVETPTQARRRGLAGHVARVFDDAQQTFGCRRIAAQLNREGYECSVGLVANLMRELGLKAVQPRAYKRTTIAGEQPSDSPDLIGRDFNPARTNEATLHLALTAGAPRRTLGGHSRSRRRSASGRSSAGRGTPPWLEVTPILRPGPRLTHLPPERS